MKSSELTEKTIYAYNPRTSSSYAQPAQLVEARMWRRDEKWDTWDGEPKRTKQTVVSRAVKGDRAGRSDGWSATSWAIGFPVLVLDAHDYNWTTAKVKIAELPYLIFAKAWHQMNPDRLVEEGHDGRFTEESPVRTVVDVRMSDGEIMKFTVTLEFVRPQALIQDWNSYLGEKKATIERNAAFEAEQAEKRQRGNLKASAIRNRVDAILGAPESYDENVERPDLHRKSVSTGNTYEVSEETLLRLIALAEKGSSQ